MCGNLGRLVRWHCSSFIYTKRWHFVGRFIVRLLSVVSSLGLQLTFCGLAKVAILPQMFIRSTHFKFTKNCHTKHWTATFAKPLLPAGVLSVEWRKSLSVVVFAVIVELWMGLFVSAVASGFKNFRREGILKNNFSFGGRGGSSFAIFGLRLGLCELQMCLHLCVRICSCSQVL